MSTTAAPSQTTPSEFHAALVLAVLLTIPAVYLVGKGELSAHDALVRFGCACAFAAGGVALLLSTVGASPAPAATASAAAPTVAAGGAGDLREPGP